MSDLTTDSEVTPILHTTSAHCFLDCIFSLSFWASDEEIMQSVSNHQNIQAAVSVVMMDHSVQRSTTAFKS